LVPSARPLPPASENAALGPMPRMPDPSIERRLPAPPPGHSRRRDHASTPMGRRHGSRTVYTLLVLRTQPTGTPRHTGRVCDQVPVDSPQDAAMSPTTGFDQG